MEFYRQRTSGSIPKGFKMKVIIDARWIFPEISGIGLYTTELIKALTAVDTDSDYIILFSNQTLLDRTAKETSMESFPNFKAELFEHGVFSLKSQLLMPGFLNNLHADVFHSPNYMIPLNAFPRRKMGRTACAITIHDLIPLLFPDHAPKSKKSRMMPLYKFVMKQAAARADAILTVSENSAKDIRTLLLSRHDRPSKVLPVYNGVSAEFFNIEHTPSLDPIKLLYVGRLDPYKNVTGLVSILSKVKKSISQKVILTIAGPPDPRYPEPQHLAEKLGVDKDITWTGYVTSEQLKEHYRTSSVLVHPAHYEGFGLPVIEAMAAGLPVVCSSAGSLAEVAGDSAAVHDKDDESGFVESICSILNSAAKSRELSRKGREQARKFLWENTAKQTLEVYQRLSEEKSTN